jgi:hypothetical protein
LCDASALDGTGADRYADVARRGRAAHAASSGFVAGGLVAALKDAPLSAFVESTLAENPTLA